MKFQIERTSCFGTAWGQKVQPCPGAVLVAASLPGSRWESRWEIEVPDLPALLALIKQMNQDFILSLEEGQWKIEIYDAHRE
jgi:hypothetical protein